MPLLAHQLVSFGEQRGGGFRPGTIAAIRSLAAPRDTVESVRRALRVPQTNGVWRRQVRRALSRFSKLLGKVHSFRMILQFAQLMIDATYVVGGDHRRMIDRQPGAALRLMSETPMVRHQKSAA